MNNTDTFWKSFCDFQKTQQMTLDQVLNWRKRQQRPKSLCKRMLYLDNERMPRHSKVYKKNFSEIEEGWDNKFNLTPSKSNKHAHKTRRHYFTNYLNRPNLALHKKKHK